ncbi:MAG: hypothetical protein ACON32_10090 [Pirellulaceae bacterium]
MQTNMQTNMQRLADHLIRYCKRPDHVEHEQTAIHRAIVNDSSLVDQPNFTRISTRTLHELFREYDQRFFLGQTMHLVHQRSGSLNFRLSKRMTKTGGKTTRIDYGHTSASGRVRSYEITLSSHLLFQGFKTPDAKERVSGVVCHDRLEATQRIFEHEMLHLMEMLLWVHSSCAETRFKSIARRMFGHTESTHQLPTRGEFAKRRYGLTAGQRVEFQHEGERLTGFVNRIGQRATVLVRHPGGELYSDGHRYRKFYVPLGQLAPESMKRD